MQICNAELIGNNYFYLVEKRRENHKHLSHARTKLLRNLKLIDENQFIALLWIS